MSSWWHIIFFIVAVLNFPIFLKSPERLLYSHYFFTRKIKDIWLELPHIYFPPNNCLSVFVASSPFSIFWNLFHQLYFTFYTSSRLLLWWLFSNHVGFPYIKDFFFFFNLLVSPGAILHIFLLLPLVFPREDSP